MFKFIARVWNAVVDFFFGKKEETAATSTKEDTSFDPLQTGVEVPVAKNTVEYYSKEETVSILNAAFITAGVTVDKAEEFTAFVTAGFSVNESYLSKSEYSLFHAEQVRILAKKIETNKGFYHEEVWGMFDGDGKVSYDSHPNTFDDLEADLAKSKKDIRFTDSLSMVICKKVLLKAGFDVARDVYSYMYLFNEMMNYDFAVKSISIIDEMDFSAYCADTFFLEIGFIKDTTLEKIVDNYSNS